jgi:hypothetical protein
MNLDHSDTVQDHKHDRLDELGFGREGRRTTVTCVQCQKSFECWQAGEVIQPLCEECLLEI